MKSYDIETLVSAVQDYFIAKEDWQMFLKTWIPGWWEDKTAEQREMYIKLSERYNAAHNAVITICKLVDIDFNTLMAIVKAIARHEKNHGKYDRCIHYTHRDSNAFRRIIDDSWDKKWLSGYYQSTGRKIAA